MIPDALLAAQLDKTLASTHFVELGTFYEGKVRDNYTKGGERLLIATDRVSAFDVVLGTIPWKGQVLNQLAAHWFEATKSVAPSHFIDLPDPNVTRAVECVPVPVEMVVRAYLTGTTKTSILYHYERGARVYCGHKLPEGLRKHEPLPAPLITPTTKAEKGGHDENISREELIARGTVDAATFDEMAALCLNLFAFGQARARERGLILVDTKYEMGRSPAGKLLFIDEIHTPDSSRYWYADDYEARLSQGEEPRGLDKDYVRRYYVGLGYRGDGAPPPMPAEIRIEAARRYVALYELLTGRVFDPSTEPPLQRIRKNLGLST